MCSFDMSTICLHIGSESVYLFILLFNENYDNPEIEYFFFIQSLFQLVDHWYWAYILQYFLGIILK